MMTNLCILVSVYYPYRWIAPFTRRLIDTHWPNHPPLFFCGLTAEEAGDLPHVPCRHPDQPRVWAQFVHEAVAQLKDRGFEACYFLLEDHPPLAACHEEHLGETLPALLSSMPASYIGLMGWDNRRFVTRAPILPPHKLMHLAPPRAPRFHLHPSLFRVDALLACLELLRNQDKQTPWGFEKICDKPDAALPEEFKRTCYQICGEEMALHPPGVFGRLGGRLERLIYHKAMNLFPPLNRLGLGMAFWDAFGFDNYFYNGPFPMIYSGVMARARVNPFFLRHLKRNGGEEPILRELLTAARAEGLV
jgi:hypothetical protein